jgi:hypothetical protein
MAAGENEISKTEILMKAELKGGVDCPAEERPAVNSEGFPIDATAADLHLETPPLRISLIGGAARSQVICRDLPEVLNQTVAIDILWHDVFVLGEPLPPRPLRQEANVL